MNDNTGWETIRKTIVHAVITLKHVILNPNVTWAWAKASGADTLQIAQHTARTTHLFQIQKTEPCKLLGALDSSFKSLKEGD